MRVHFLRHHIGGRWVFCLFGDAGRAYVDRLLADVPCPGCSPDYNPPPLPEAVALEPNLYCSTCWDVFSRLGERHEIAP